MSESNKFTPGPWTNMPRMECVPICGQHDVGLSIGFINSSNPDRMAEGRANAYLIAAAPDLLEALEMAEAMLCRLEPIIDRGEDDSISVESEILFARAAISKARGQQ